MGTLNKSFLLGTAVASVTWCISLYLYWILVQNSDGDIDASTILPKHSSFQSNSANDLGQHVGKSLISENSKHQYFDKVERYKKEKKLKKFSRKLIDELQPIVPVVSGKFVIN